MLEKRRYIGSCQTHLLLGFEWRYRGGGLNGVVVMWGGRVYLRGPFTVE